MGSAAWLAGPPQRVGQIALRPRDEKKPRPHQSGTGLRKRGSKKKLQKLAGRALRPEPAFAAKRGSQKNG